MSTLLLRFAAPLQSWGTASRFKKLTTEREPTKSGVIGLIAAALGREREADLTDLTELRFGVRVDQPGELLQDFHTAHSLDGKQAFISYRYYLCDAVFVVGLESEDEALLDQIEDALKHPRFPLYLGRRACPPAGRMVLGRESMPLEQALREQPWQASQWYQKRLKKLENVSLDMTADAPFGTVGSFTRRDLPLTFNQEHRRYAFRSLRSDVGAVLVKNPERKASGATDISHYETGHDPLASLEILEVV
jgi:CRISPR system Cascade subunit CasD